MLAVLGREIICLVDGERFGTSVEDRSGVWRKGYGSKERRGSIKAFLANKNAEIDKLVAGPLVLRA